MELAASIQKTILPDDAPGRSPGSSSRAATVRRSRSAATTSTSTRFPDGLTALCVADVSGKGVPAALLVSTVHACLHLLVPNPRATSRLSSRA